MKFFSIFITISLLIFWLVKSDVSITYADSGFMWIQIQEFLRSGFQSVSIPYSGVSFDPEGKFSAFQAPFYGKHGDNFYIGFPPYFPILFGFVSFLFSSNLSLYLVQILFFSLSVYVLFESILILTKQKFVSFCLSLFYQIGTTVSLYTLVLHEYTVALFFLYAGIYFLLRYSFHDQKENWCLPISALMMAMSLYFRLEFIFVILSWGLATVLFQKVAWKPLFSYFLPVFLMVAIVLFASNMSLHGHPLGFRYTLTMSDPITQNGDRLTIIYELLFGKKRGFFLQSPGLFLFTILACFYLVKGRLKKDDLLYFFLAFIVSFILVLLQAPNHGDHLSPRYLFGVYPSILFFTAILYKVYHDQLQKKVKLLVYGLTIITFLFSVKELYKGILFIKTSDKVVRELTEMFRSRKESVLVFGDLALPKNLQTIYFEKRQFYVKPEELQMFLNLSKIPASEILYLTTEKIGTCVKGTPICKDAEWMAYGLYRSK